MSYNNFKLELFQGDGTMNVDSYIKRFEQWQKCTKTNDEQALSALGWHLAGQARCWFESLETPPETLDALKTALIAKFKREKTVDMTIFSMKQQTGESINDFLNRLEKEAFKQELGQNIIVQIALNGLEQAVGCAISTHGPQTLDDVRRLASRQQTRSTSTVNSADVDVTSELMSKLQLMTAALTDLRTEVNMMKAGTSQSTDTRNKTETKQPRETPCSRCNSKFCYNIRSCIAMGKICHKCRKPNHFQSVCRSVRNSQNQNMNHA